jgi:hypothetical protein
LAGKLDWYTNWASTPLSGTDGLEWVPQVHGLGNVAGIATDAKKWTGVKAVLSFNERQSRLVVVRNAHKADTISGHDGRGGRLPDRRNDGSCETYGVGREPRWRLLDRRAGGCAGEPEVDAGELARTSLSSPVHG